MLEKLAHLFHKPIMVYNLCILACYLICVKGCNGNPAMIFNQAGETAILNCSFYLHSDQIYSVKWYKVNYSQEMSRPLFSGAAPVLLLHASRVSDNEVFPCERDETGRRLDISNLVTTFLFQLMLSRSNRLVLTSVSWRLSGLSNHI